MDDLDIGGIDEILKKAEQIRADIKNGLKCNEKLSSKSREYQCFGCGEYNCWLSAWCFKCGLTKNSKPVRQGTSQNLKKVSSYDYNVYNTDQLLEDLNSNQSKKVITKPREINQTRLPPRGELKVFKYYNNDERKYTECGSGEEPEKSIKSTGMSMNETKSHAESESAPGSDIESEFNVFNDSDIILYDRGENKKPKKKLIIKPLNSSPATPVKNAWEESTTRLSAKSPNLSSTKSYRPQSTTCISPQKSSIQFTSSKRPSSACTRRTVSSTPSVFDRLYKNESKSKNRTVQSSPQLLPDKVKFLKTSTVALASEPQLHVRSNKGDNKAKFEEKMIVNKVLRNDKRKFAKQMCSTPLTVSGIRQSLPDKMHVKVPYRSDQGVQWTQLPAEIWVKIMSYVPHCDLFQLMQTCSYLNNISSDTSIWSSITVSNKALVDSDLESIGERNPRNLVLSGCDGGKLTTAGVRSLFRSCAASLRELTVTDCKGGELVSSSLLLHVSARCQDLTSVHLSLCNIGDEAMSQLAARVHRLERVCIPMCSGIKDTSFRVLLQKHYRSITCLDITGCYHISADAISLLSLCPSLSQLYMGNCNQVSSATLTSLTLTSLTILDIRGCKSVSADSVIELLASNPHIHTLSLSHVTMVTDAVLERVSQVLLSLQVLDLSGCIKVTSGGIHHLVKHPIQALDLGSTAVSFRGCCAIANYLPTTLNQVSFNFCSDINDECVRKIVLKCKKLQRISLFGCSYVRNVGAFYKFNPKLIIDV